MYSSNASSAHLIVDAYEQSTSSIRRLKKSLPEDVVAGLAREVIHRLALKDSTLDRADQHPSAEELEAFCASLISDDDEAAAKIIIGIRAEGMSAEAIYLKYLAAAARMLGKWWEQDRASFVEVTVGTGRMFAIMHGMRHIFTRPFSAGNKSAVFAAIPGEDHTLGVCMAADIFRKNGWEIALKVGYDHDALVAELEHTPSSIIGLSIGGRHSIDALSRLIVALHICCPDALLLVSGQGIRSIKPLLSLMGVDGIACDLEEAKQQMASLWDRRQSA